MNRTRIPYVLLFALFLTTAGNALGQTRAARPIARASRELLVDSQHRDISRRINAAARLRINHRFISNARAEALAVENPALHRQLVTEARERVGRIVRETHYPVELVPAIAAESGAAETPDVGDRPSPALAPEPPAEVRPSAPPTNATAPSASEPLTDVITTSDVATTPDWVARFRSLVSRAINAALNRMTSAARALRLPGFVGSEAIQIREGDTAQGFLDRVTSHVREAVTSEVDNHRRLVDIRTGLRDRTRNGTLTESADFLLAGDLGGQSFPNPSRITELQMNQILSELRIITFNRLDANSRRGDSAATIDAWRALDRLQRSERLSARHMNHAIALETQAGQRMIAQGTAELEIGNVAAARSYLSVASEMLGAEHADVAVLRASIEVESRDSHPAQ